MINGVTKALFDAGDDIIKDAQISISEGATSGAGHVPSAPGTPPNNDGGVLAGSGETVVLGPLKVESSFNAPYAAAQEFGSEQQGLPERPYMRPAAQRNRPNAQAKVVAAVNRVIR